MITHAWQILHPAAANQHNRVLLQFVADARNVGGDFDPVGQTNTGDLAQRRVRLLRGLRVHAGTDASFLRAKLQRRTRRLVARPLPARLHQLIKCRHSCCSSQVVGRRSFVVGKPNKSRTTGDQRQSLSSIVLARKTGLPPSQFWHRPIAPSHTLPRTMPVRIWIPVLTNRRRR